MPPLNGGLLVVRLQNRLEAPTSLVIEVASRQGGESAAFNGTLHRSLPGHYADYLFALALPPGEYALAAVHETSISGGVLATLAAAIKIGDGPPGYLGRLVIAVDPGGGASGLRIDDRYDDDTLLFRTTIDRLKSVEIGRNVISAQALDALAQPGTASGNGGRIDLTLVADGAEAQLPAASRAAFAKFLRSKAPRAFATSETGQFGSATGANAVDRALRNCAKQAGARGCRLVAVDDTLIAPGSCRATLAGAGADAPTLAGCGPVASRAAPAVQ